MASEHDLTCTEEMQMGEDDNAMTQAQALLRRWTCPAFVSSMCMGTHARLGLQSPLLLMDVDLAREIYELVRRMSLSEYIDRTGSVLGAEVRHDVMWTGPLGFFVDQCTRGEMVRVCGKSVLQVFVGSTDGSRDEHGQRLLWRVDVRLAEILVSTEGTIEIPSSAMSVESNAKGRAAMRNVDGALCSCGNEMHLRCGTFRFHVSLMPADVWPTRTSNEDFFLQVDERVASVWGSDSYGLV